VQVKLATGVQDTSVLVVLISVKLFNSKFEDNHTKNILHRMPVFIDKCLRQTSNTGWPDKSANTEVQMKTDKKL